MSSTQESVAGQLAGQSRVLVDGERAPDECARRCEGGDRTVEWVGRCRCCGRGDGGRGRCERSRRRCGQRDGGACEWCWCEWVSCEWASAAAAATTAGVRDQKRDERTRECVDASYAESWEWECDDGASARASAASADERGEARAESESDDGEF